MSVVYWIRRSCHTMVGVEGYIGVSSRPERRFKEHKQQALSGTHCNHHLSNAINKYDDIVFDIIFEGTTNDCYSLEEFYRPEGCIGWNNSKGGCVSTKGYKHRQSSKDKISKARAGMKFTEEHKRNIAKNCHKFGTGSDNVSARKVRCIELNKVFNTMQDAAKYIGLKSISGICLVCQGKQETAKSYKWEYA